MKKSVLLLIVISINIFISIFKGLDFSITLLNNLFLTSLLLLMIGGILFLLEGGFFNIIIYGFKKFYHNFSTVGRYVAEETDQTDDVASFEFASTNSFLIIGGCLFITTFLIGLII